MYKRQPEARYVYEEVELPEDIIMSHAVELADGSLRFISSYSYVRENEDGSTAFVSQSSLWSLSASGEAEQLAVLSDGTSEERFSGFVLAPDGGFFCSMYPVSYTHLDVYKRQAVSIPIVGMGGVSSAEDVIEMLLAGAAAVEMCIRDRVGTVEIIYLMFIAFVSLDVISIFV